VVLVVVAAQIRVVWEVLGVLAVVAVGIIPMALRLVLAIVLPQVHHKEVMVELVLKVGHRVLAVEVVVHQLLVLLPHQAQEEMAALVLHLQ